MSGGPRRARIAAGALSLLGEGGGPRAGRRRGAGGGHGAAVGRDHFGHDREPEPAPPSSRARASSRRTNRSNTRAAFGLGDPGPVVVDGEHARGRRPRASANATAARAWRAALSARLRTHAPQLRGVAAHPCRPRPRSCRRAVGVVARSRGASSSTRSSRSTGPRSPREPCLVGAGEQQQVLDQALHAQVLGEHGLGQLGHGRCARGGRARPRRAGGSWRRASAARATRRRRTGAGAPAPRSSRSSMRFIVAASRAISSCAGGFGHPAVQLGRGDRVDLAADRLDRREGAADDHPRVTADDEQEQRDADARGAPDHHAASTRRPSSRVRATITVPAAVGGRRPRRRPGSPGRRRRRRRRPAATRPVAQARGHRRTARRSGSPRRRAGRVEHLDELLVLVGDRRASGPAAARELERSPPPRRPGAVPRPGRRR